MTRQAIILVLTICFLSFPGEALGQVASDTLDVIVSRIQARGIYVDASEAKWIRGDTLSVTRNGELPGIARVAGKSSGSLLLAWLSSPLALEVGDALRLIGPERVTEVEESSDLLPPEERESILGRPSQTVAVARARKIEVHGYYSASLTASYSDVKGQFTDTRSTSRKFMTPVSSVRLRVEGLPGNGRFLANVRGSQRFSSSKIIGKAGSVRLYELKYLSNPTSKLSIETGRFRERHTPAGGYWDGLSTTYDLGRVRLGVSAGFEPDRYSEAFSTDISKISVFSDIDRRHPGGSTSLLTAFTRVDGDLLAQPYSYFSIEQKSRIGKTRLSTSLQIDNSPADDTWKVSRLYLRASAPISKSLSINARYGSRQHFSYWRDNGRYSSKKDQISAGIAWRGAVSHAGLTLTSNSFSGNENSNSVSTSFRTRPRWLPFSFSNNASLFRRTGGNTIYNSTSLQKELKRITLGIEYSLLVVDRLGPTSLSHIAGLSIRARFDRWGYLSVRQRMNLSSTVTSSTMYINYGISF